LADQRQHQRRPPLPLALLLEQLTKLKAVGA
jgi:hypothetical protein